MDAKNADVSIVVFDVDIYESHLYLLSMKGFGALYGSMYHLLSRVHGGSTQGGPWIY